MDLCKSHFCDFVERRVKRELREQLAPLRPRRIAVGVSGGKDSIVLLNLLASTLGPDRRIEIVAVTVDEGIDGYRPAGVAVAERAASILGVEHRVIRFRETFNVTLDELVAANPGEPPCASCGVLRRRALNDAAREVGADAVATGHNLDDVAQSILMNYVQGDVERLARLGPHARLVPGLVPRIMPLRLLPEREVALYAVVKGLEVDIHDCPNAATATRGIFRDMLLDLEERRPGARHAILAGYDRLVPLLRDGAIPSRPATRCQICGETSSGDTCRACQVTASFVAQGGG